MGRSLKPYDPKERRGYYLRDRTRQIENAKLYHAKDKSKWIAYRKQYYAKNKERMKALMKAKCLKVRAYIDKCKNVPCGMCGQVYHPCVMDFDHIDPKSKTMPVGRMLGASLIRVKQEIAKCRVLCANCHRMRSHRQRTAKRLSARLRILVKNGGDL